MILYMDPLQDSILDAGHPRSLLIRMINKQGFLSDPRFSCKSVLKTYVGPIIYYNEEE